uniref:Tumor protein D52 n=1 Tax=Monodelphis domestica TaxID=13616 RepID=A0A5F8GVQ7_MONDO
MERGLLKTDQVPEEGEDAVATISATETLSEEEQEELRKELAKVEEEIQTLSQVLAAKEKHLAEIKRKLGINSLQELRQNIARGWQDVTATSAYKKTSETLSQAGQKASAAFSSVGSVITKKLEDVKNSPTFKSFEEKVENLKVKVMMVYIFVVFGWCLDFSSLCKSFSSVFLGIYIYHVYLYLCIYIYHGILLGVDSREIML